MTLKGPASEPDVAFDLQIYSELPASMPCALDETKMKLPEAAGVVARCIERRQETPLPGKVSTGVQQLLNSGGKRYSRGGAASQSATSARLAPAQKKMISLGPGGARRPQERRHQSAEDLIVGYFHSAKAHIKAGNSKVPIVTSTDIVLHRAGQQKRGQNPPKLVNENSPRNNSPAPQAKPPQAGEVSMNDINPSTADHMKRALALKQARGACRSLTASRPPTPWRRSCRSSTSE